MTKTSFAPAKINISLDIISKMADGYHNMKMIMQTVSLSDEITIECVPGEGISAEAGLPYLPGDERNIAVKAALAFYAFTGIKGNKTRIRMKKNIPVCAGLGGGSADGACVLRMLDTLFETNLGSERLEKIGAGVGSDVPFCIAGGTKLAEGRGDVLTNMPSIPPCSIVICKPPFSCSTPELFRLVKCDKIRARPDTDGIVAALERSDLSGIARRMYNVFEDVMPRGVREITDIKYSMLNSGALGAVMTGSGPTVIGVFDDEISAQRAFEHLRSNYGECFIAEPVGQLV